MKKSNIATGVLVHGRHLQAKNWEQIIWGNPPDLLGQVPKGVLSALQENAKVIIFGTGASEKNGRKEAEVIRDYLFDNFFKLKGFKAFKEFTKTDLEKLKKKIEKISKVEIKSQNTVEEARFAGYILKREGVKRIILVSCPTHISRCVRDAYSVFEQDKSLRHFTGNLLAAPSQVSYANSKISDVVVIEPPHRGDIDSLPLHLYAKRLLGVSPEKKADFLDKLDILLKKYSA